MSEQAQAIMAHIQDQYQRNMQWLKAVHPALASALEAPSDRSVNINVDDGGQITFRLSSPETGAIDLSQQALRQAAEERLRKMAGAERPFLNLIGKEDLKTFLEQGSPVRFVDEAFLLREYGEVCFPGIYPRLHQAYRAALGEGSYVGYPQFGKDFIPIVVAVGSIEGWQLDRLVEQWNVRHLILVDTYPAGMNLSLCFTDLPALAERFAREGRRLTLLMDTKLELLAHRISNEILQFWPPHFYHGLVWFTGVHMTHDLHKLSRHLDELVRLANEGWGFFEDELASLRHAHFNLLQKELPVCQEIRSLPPGCTAIVCAAGPSLDDTIEFIKANRDNAVVFSCGTALRRLYNEGILPDFHVEIERLATTVDYLRLQVPPDALKRITLIAPSLIYPDIANHCAETLLIAKLKDVGSSIFLSDCPQFQLTGPTVTNCVLNLCVEFKFSDIVLCGLDLGWLEQGRHHATGTVYEDAELLQSKSGQTIKPESSYQESAVFMVKGNFRDTVRTDPILDSARMQAEALFSVAKQTRVFNTADGAYINGTVPVRIEALELEPAALPNRQVVDRIKSGFKPVAAAAIAQREPIAARSLGAFIDSIRAKIPASIDSRRSWLGLMVNLRVDVPPGDPQLMTGWVLLSGSLLLFLHYLHIAVCSLEDETAAATLAEQGRRLLLDMLDQAEQTGTDWQKWPATHRPAEA